MPLTKTNRKAPKAAGTQSKRQPERKENDLIASEWHKHSVGGFHQGKTMTHTHTHTQKIEEMFVLK